MKKNIVIIILIAALLACVIYIIFNNSNKSSEILKLKVIESYNTYSLARVNGTDEIVEIDIPNLSIDDELEVYVREYLETYPRIVKYKSYELLRNKEISKEELDDKTSEVTSSSKNGSTEGSSSKRTSASSSKTTNNNVDNTKKVNSSTTMVTTTTKTSLTKIPVVTQIENDINNSENISTKDKAKALFIKIVDFIFYDKDINGYYFKELTASAKLKVMSLALKLDTIIDKNFPGYKEELSESYKNAKSKLVELYLNTTTDICDKNSELCDLAKSDFNLLKKSCNLTWDIIKSLGETGIDKLKKWYEIYSGK